jgi:hypothetical protein
MSGLFSKPKILPPPKPKPVRMPIPEDTKEQGLLRRRAMARRRGRANTIMTADLQGTQGTGSSGQTLGA